MRAAIAVAALALVACDDKGHAPDGAPHGHCLPNNQCNPGLSCVQGFCLGAAPHDGRVTGNEGVVLIDAPIIFDAVGFTCADDTSLEPNDTIHTAFQTPISSQQATFSLAGLAICPPTDRDTYAVDVASLQTLSATITFSNGAPLSVAVLNSGGQALDLGTASGPSMVRASVANLPAGTYFVEVSTPSGENNYSLAIAATQ